MKTNEYSLSEFLNLLQNGDVNTARKQAVVENKIKDEKPIYDNKQFLTELNKDFNPYNNFSSRHKLLGKKK
jgi:hypothetical protein